MRAKVKSRRRLTSVIAIVLIFSAAVFLSMVALCRASSAADDPSAHLESVLAERSHISSVDKEALRKVVADQMSSAESRVPFSRMSPRRRELVTSLINQAVERFHKDPSLNSPLQSQYAAASLRMSLVHAFNAPVFAPTNSALVAAQIRQLAAAVRAVAEAQYKDIVGTPIASTLEERVASRLHRVASDDMSPSMKYPLANEDFIALLKQVSDECRSRPAAVLSADGHLSPDWGTMDDKAREDFLGREAETILNSISSSFAKGLFDVDVAYSKKALANQFKEIEPYAPPVSITKSDLDAFDALARRARAEAIELSKQWEKTQQARLNDQLERASMGVESSDAPSTEGLGLAKESLTDAAYTPVISAAGAQTPSGAPEDRNSGVPTQGGSRGRGALAAVGAAFILGLLVAAVVLSRRGRRRSSH